MSTTKKAAGTKAQASSANGQNGVNTAEPILNQQAKILQKFGTVLQRVPIALDEQIRLTSTEGLNQILADTITIRDLYKKHHWQTVGPTFYQLHLLFDKHYEEQNVLVDAIAERIQLLGGLSIAMAADVADLTSIQRPPKDREEVPVQISRLLEAHNTILANVREVAKKAADAGDDGTNDLLISQVLRTNEMQTWFLFEHVVDTPVAKAD
jgi:starvation-inducible DNA-binding protein